jgi:hypothetical protein
VNRPLDFITDHPRFAILWVAIVGPIVLLFLIFEIIPATSGAQQSFQTLQSDLAKVHLPSGYRMTGERRTGTDCHHSACSIIQTWTWPSARRRTTTSACNDAYRAMTKAFSGVYPDSPIPATAACDYFATVVSFSHPAQGKRSIEVIVQNDKTASSSFIVSISAAYLQ